ncbi:rCG25349, isoform CRA_a [Rattus norvegicus]|uniref:RCG25349, isoform CRA_a n=1 Tax=Rattus norvegicus TaxID=10116 RepID=A6I1Z0_RAT|nr:rCG25349, isoform CRA_a [Rattus norvegicus]EDL77592.1 rCG25349, isoform CRA_a [Rattus norvegicus]EDL77593.1 rCG25349, isoform CRA_a [Rattus norvegicus]EDL77594.1 rCG25349, isoform CRA_a [Rattus norvegicus]
MARKKRESPGAGSHALLQEKPRPHVQPRPIGARRRSSLDLAQREL